MTVVRGYCQHREEILEIAVAKVKEVEQGLCVGLAWGRLEGSFVRVRA